MGATKTIKRSTLRELTRLVRVHKQEGNTKMNEIIATCQALAMQVYGRDSAWLSFCDIAFAVMGWYPLKTNCTDEEFEELFKWLGFEIDESEYGKYIDREAFLEHMKKTDRYFAVKYDIENFPSVDINRPTKSQFKRMAVQMDYAPVIHGRWDDIPNAYMSVVSKTGAYHGNATTCSVCHEVNPNAFKTNYCPNCGARMME